jgi:hypothetical protein
MSDSAEIRTWRLADDLPAAIYQITRTFPRKELDEMGSEPRSSSSVGGALGRPVWSLIQTVGLNCEAAQSWRPAWTL